MLYDKIRFVLNKFQRIAPDFLHIAKNLKGKTMKPNNKEKISEYLRTIAEQEGISEDEVRNEIAYAISLALKSKDPKIQNFWKNIPCEGDSPTIEEIIGFLATQISKQK